MLRRKENQQRPTQMLEIDKNFKSTIKTILSEIRENMLTTNETMRTVSRKIETIKN